MIRGLIAYVQATRRPGSIRTPFAVRIGSEAAPSGSAQAKQSLPRRPGAEQPRVHGANERTKHRFAWLRRLRAIGRAARVFAGPAAFRGIRPLGVVAAVRVLRGRIGPHIALPLHAALHPHRAAIVDPSRRLDWRAFDREVAAVAAGLVELGVRSGDRVAIVMPNCIEHVAIQQAIMRVGATAVQIGYRLTASEIAYILADARPSAVVTHRDHAAEVIAASDRTGVPAPSRQVVVGGDSTRMTYAELVRAGSRRLPASTDARASGLMIYTSGTTGRPKGAMRSYRAGIEPLVDFMRQLGMSSTERHLVVCPLYHTGAFGFVTMMAGLGAASVILPHFDPEDVLAVIARERITSAFVVPTMLVRLLAVEPAVLARHDTSSLRWVASGAAPLATDTARRFQDRFGEILWNFYGATETGVVTLAGPRDHVARPGTIGRPLRGAHIRLLDEHGADVPDGGIGELYVRSPMLIGGYHANRRATDAAMRDGYFSVGDLARRDRDGYLYLESRASDMIISGGVNIYPREIEERLGEHPDVVDCAVVGMPDVEWGERVVAFVVPRTQARSPAFVDVLAEHCRSQLAGYKCPRRIELVDELPRNETGKLLKRALRERLATKPIP